MIVLFGMAGSPRPALAQIRTRPRPAASYLRGPFVLLNIAVRFTWRENGRIVTTLEHLMVRDRGSIARLVHAVDMDRTVPTIFPPCLGGAVGSVPFPDPEWLSFVRADGSKEHMWYGLPCTGYSIHGVLLADPVGAIWRVILTLIGGRG